MRDDFDFDEYNLSGGSESNDFGGFVSDSDFERAFFSEDALDKDQGVTPDQVPRDQVTGMPVNGEAKGYPNSGSRPKTEDRVVHKSQEMGMRDPRLKHHSRNQVRPRNQAGNPRPQVKQSSNNIPNSTPSIQSSNVQGSMRGENVNTSDKPSKSGKKSKGGKKKSKLPLVIVPIVAVAVIAGVFLSGNKLEPQIEVYETTGRYAYDVLQSALQSYDAETLDDVVGTEDGDSYLSQEWSYANNNEIRESFIKTVCANTSFKYPQVPQLSTTGKEMTQDGNPILVTSSMNNGEKAAFMQLQAIIGVSKFKPYNSKGEEHTFQTFSHRINQKTFRKLRDLGYIKDYEDKFWKKKRIALAKLGFGNPKDAMKKEDIYDIRFKLTGKPMDLEDPELRRYFPMVFSDRFRNNCQKRI